jgi:hypothetical protein
MIRKLDGPQRRSGRFGDDKTLLPYRHRTPDSPVRSVVSILTPPSRLQNTKIIYLNFTLRATSLGQLTAVLMAQRKLPPRTVQHAGINTLHAVQILLRTAVGLYCQTTQKYTGMLHQFTRKTDTYRQTDIRAQTN